MELEEALKQVEQLKQGLEARGRVGTAIGILMERYGLDPDQAFNLLVRVSQAENRKLKVIAEEIIAGRDIAGDPD